jgi:hypothetical protein
MIININLYIITTYHYIKGSQSFYNIKPSSNELKVQYNFKSSAIHANICIFKTKPTSFMYRINNRRYLIIWPLRGTPVEAI